MIGVSGRVQDFSGNPDPVEEPAALLEPDDDVAVPGNIDIVVLRLCPGLHDWDGINLNIEYEEGNTFSLQFLGKPCVVNMIMGGKRVANLTQGDVHPLEICLHSSEGSRPADVNQQARSPRTDNPVVG